MANNKEEKFEQPNILIVGVDNYLLYLSEKVMYTWVTTGYKVIESPLSFKIENLQII